MERQKVFGMNLGLKGEDFVHSEIVQWARKEELRHRELCLLYHIPNGGSRHKAEAMRLKALGVRAGCPDLHLAVGRHNYMGLWLEIKDGTKGKLSEVQKIWHQNLQEENHFVAVIRTPEEGIETIKWYLNL